MNILIIGSTSLVGRTLKDQLTSAGMRYDTYDREDGFDLFCARPVAEWEEQLTGYDAVVYLAWAGVPSDETSSLQSGVNVNIRCIREICSALKVMNQKHFVFFSTAGAIYGNSEGVITEEAACKPFSHYGQSKLDAETLIEQLSASGEDFQYTCLRLSNIYGPRLKVKQGFDLINHLLNSIKNKTKFQIYGDGENTRDFIFVEDAASAVVACLSQESSASHILNICNGASNSINEVCAAIEEATQSKIDYDVLPARECDVRYINLSNAKAVSVLEWKPAYSISDGVSLTVKALAMK